MFLARKVTTLPPSKICEMGLRFWIEVGSMGFMGLVEASKQRSVDTPLYPIVGE